MQKIQNPILKGFNPDPSIIFVEPYYYIATSTFEYYPGVQIHRSLDLVDWDVVARPVTEDKINLRGVSESCGVWAPCLSHDNGIFYLVYSNVTLWTGAPFKDVANYIITATDIEGVWSKPIYINSSGFDASLFHDTDGKKYFVNMEWDYRNPEQDAFTGIILQEMDPKSFALLGTPRKIFLGTSRKLVEGPHIYQRNGYYYLLTAEGGTVSTHAATLARSQSIWGEYVLHPNTHLLTSDGYGCKLKKAGHASLCEGKDGWLMAHLVGRPEIEGRCPLGRETAIQNIEWIDDWAYVSGGGQSPSDFFEVPSTAQSKPKRKEIGFDKKSLSLRWQSLRKDVKHKYKADKNSIVLQGGNSWMSVIEQSTLVYRQQDFCFEASVRLDFSPEHFQHLAGLVYRYNEHNQYLLLMTKEGGKQYLTLHSVIDGVWDLDDFEKRYEVGDTVYLKLVVDREVGQYYFSQDNQNFLPIGKQIAVSTLSDESANPLGFTGAFVGVYVGDFSLHKHAAKFSNFVYKSDTHG
ncbi:MAG: glycoside hydrolase family 43 protein [Firmicutes bacterium]|nr:glycoside hydrolase family 43 protein [Bacillota bacterium]